MTLGVSSAAQAQTTFVSNLEQTTYTDLTTSASRIVWRAQQFTTGNIADGYTLSEIVVDTSASPQPGRHDFALYTSTASDEPGTRITNLSGNARAGGVQVFTPVTPTVLGAGTKYFVVLSMKSGIAALESTVSNNADPGASSGWDIADTSRTSPDTGASWMSTSRTVKFAVRGTANVPTVSLFALGTQGQGGTIVLDEGQDGTIVFSRTRDWAFSQSLTVPLEYEDLTDDGVDDPDADAPDAVNFPAGQDTVLVSVGTLSDAIHTGVDRAFSVSVPAPADGSYSVAQPASVTYTVRDTDLPPLVRIFPVFPDRDEPEGSAVSFRLTRTGNTAAPLTVNLEVTESGDVVAPGDEGARTVTFDAGSDSATLDIDTEDDTAAEKASVVTVALVADPAVYPAYPAYRLGANASADATVVDDDNTLLSFVNIDATEEGAPVVFTLKRIGDTTVPLTVNLEITESGDVVAPGDEGARTVTFVAGSDTATFSVPTVDDMRDEPDSVVKAEFVADDRDPPAYVVGVPGSDVSASVAVADTLLPSVFLNVADSDVRTVSSSNTSDGRLLGRLEARFRSFGAVSPMLPRA